MAVLPIMPKEKFVKKYVVKEEDGVSLSPVPCRWMKVQQDSETFIFEPLRIRRIIVNATDLWLYLDGNVELRLTKDETVINELCQRLNIPPEYFQK